MGETKREMISEAWSGAGAGRRKQAWADSGDDFEAGGRDLVMVRGSGDESRDAG